ncbi:MAG: hypothetical protein ACAH08_01515 [Methylophilus sp.]|uniref:hypothetical protein n=1 Tax=Methylophilus sp. TaxID=29541 RepID=UPI002BFF994D|nr:hypothetical protein [Methylophilus sp.]HSH86808.1 hypothetical protein [Methylophilus sp.]
MKKLIVTIQVELDIPDTWDVVEHPDQVQAIKMDDGQYMHMSFLPMMTRDFNEDAEWSSECSDAFTDAVLDMVADEEVYMKLETH